MPRLGTLAVISTLFTEIIDAYLFFIDAMFIRLTLRIVRFTGAKAQ